MNFFKFGAAIASVVLCLVVWDSGEVEAAPLQVYNQPTPARYNQQAPVQYSNRPKPRRPYYLDSGDVLGVFLEGVLGKLDSMPPIYYPPEGSGLGPSMGYPIVVRENGKVSLPLVEPISVSGLTVMQAEARIKSAYLGNNKSGKQILKEDSRVLISLQRKRTVNVIVIRQDNGSSFNPSGIIQRGPVNSRSDLSARSSTVQLPADQSNLLHALLQSGGLPGLNAKPEARVYRSQNGASNSSFGGSGVGASFPRSQPNGRTSAYRVPLQPNTPLRGTVGARLSDGDIVVVEAKPTEVFYTSGLLRSAQHPFPRDRSINILEAVALAGGPVANRGAGFGIPQLPPTELSIIRDNPRYGQANFRVDLNRAMVDPSQRITVMPGDHLILRYKPAQTIGNIGIGTLNTYGLRQVFN